MYREIKMITLAVATLFAPGLLNAQFDFSVDGKTVQMHSFAQQGFALSNENNFLSMDTSGGSFAMTDGGINASVALTDKFRVGAQVYARNIGQLGDYHVQLDWAYGDYKFKDWFGVRGGKIKTALGLFNDIQDNEFLQTWALLPQGVYPLDLRSNTIAHTGARLIWRGARSAGPEGLKLHGVCRPAGERSLRRPVLRQRRGQRYRSRASAEERWAWISAGTLPVQGLMLGGSWANQTMNLDVIVRFRMDTCLCDRPQHARAYYVRLRRLRSREIPFQQRVPQRL